MLLTLSTWLSPQTTAEQIMVLYRDTGKKRYLNQLVDDFYDDLNHYLTSQSDFFVAQDISQKTWLKVIEKRALFKTHTSFKSWLFTMARHALIDEFRRQNKLAQLDQEKLANIQSEQTECSDMVLAFNRALERLNFYQREAFILQQEGFSVNEISLITNCEFETVKSRLRYAKQNLREMIQECCDE